MAQAYINGKDIYTTYGAVLCKGAYEALLTPPPAKEYVSNDSRNQNGVRMIAETTKIASRNVSFDVFIRGASQTDYLSKYASFLSAITSGVFTLGVSALNLNYKLVYSECSKYGNYGLKMGKFTVKCIEPNIDNRTALA